MGEVWSNAAVGGENSTVKGRDKDGCEEEAGCAQNGGFSWVGVVSVGEPTASPFPRGPTTLYWRGGKYCELGSDSQTPEPQTDHPDSPSGSPFYPQRTWTLESFCAAKDKNSFIKVFYFN